MYNLNKLYLKYFYINMRCTLRIGLEFFMFDRWCCFLFRIRSDGDLLRFMSALKMRDIRLHFRDAISSDRLFECVYVYGPHSSYW